MSVKNISQETWQSEPIHKFFINNIYKIIFCIIVFVMVVIIANNGKSLKNISPYVFALIALSVIVEQFHRRVAYEIAIPKGKGHELILRLYRSNRTIRLKASELKRIYINGYLIIKTEKEKIYFGGNVSEDLFIGLSNLKSIGWGRLCFLLGPPKGIREKLQRSIHK